MRGLLIALLLIAALAVGADVLVTRAAEARVAEEVERSMGGEAEVDLRGWPVSLGLLQGQVDEAAINATSVPMRDTGAMLPSLDVLLTGVRLPYVGAGGGEVSADTGRFSARIDQATLTDLIARAGAGDVAQVQIAGDSLQVVIGGVAIELDVVARDGALVVRPVNGLLSAVSGEQVVPLQGLPAGTTLEQARIEDGALVLEGPVDLQTLLTG